MTFARKKPKKEVMPWRQGILSHHISRPSAADRNEFPAKVIKELIKEADGKCQCGCGRPDQSTHHVMPRGRGGRGVKTNGMRVNNICHDRIQTDEEELKYWIREYRNKYGNYFWYDDQDWEERSRKLALEEESFKARQQQLDQIQPVAEVITRLSGRALRAKEMRFLEALDQKEVNVLTGLINDIEEAQNRFTIKPSYAYGERFED